MILWVKGEAVGMPCSQRVEVVTASLSRIVVKRCGDGVIKHVQPDDLIGVELSDRLDVMFTVKGWKSQNIGTIHPCCRS